MTEAVDEAFKPDPKRPVDPRPTDLECFFDLLPNIIGGLAARKNDIHSIMSEAFIIARNAVGQCNAMGITRPITSCTDSTPLGTPMNIAQTPGVQPPVQHHPTPGGGNIGVMATNQYPTPPSYANQQQQGGVVGQGGLVAQHPTNGGGGLVSMYPTQQPMMQGQPGAGVGRPSSNGWKGEMIAQFPNDPTVHPIAQPPQPPQPPPGYYPYPPPGYAAPPGYAPPGYPPPPQGYAPPAQPQQPPPGYAAAPPGYAAPPQGYPGAPAAGVYPQQAPAPPVYQAPPFQPPPQAAAPYAQPQQAVPPFQPPPPVAAPPQR